MLKSKSEVSVLLNLKLPWPSLVCRVVNQPSSYLWTSELPHGRPSVPSISSLRPWRVVFSFSIWVARYFKCWCSKDKITGAIPACKYNFSPVMYHFFWTSNQRKIAQCADVLIYTVASHRATLSFILSCVSLHLADVSATFTQNP